MLLQQIDVCPHGRRGLPQHPHWPGTCYHLSAQPAKQGWAWRRKEHRHEPAVVMSSRAQYDSKQHGVEERGGGRTAEFNI